MTTTAAASARVSYDDPAALLAAIGGTADERRAVEVRQLRLVLAWADLHSIDPSDSSPEAPFRAPMRFAGEGSPVIDEFCVAELAARLAQTTDSTGRVMAEVVELAHRLPRLWARVVAGEVAPWRARLVAASTMDLSREAAAFVDAEVHWCLTRLTGGDLTRLLDTARVRFMPELAARLEQASLDTRHVSVDRDQVGFDGTLGIEARLTIPDAHAVDEVVTLRAAELKALGSTDTLDGRRATALGDLARHQLALDLTSDQPAAMPTTAGTGVVLHVHMPADALTPDPAAEQVGQAAQVLTGWVEEAGRRVFTVEQIRAWCGRPDARVTVKPVIDLRQRLATDGYIPTARIREHVILRDGGCMFPWCGRSARRADLDHVVPYDPAAAADGRPQPGPTSTDNLQALCRRHHRLKTHGRWRVTMPQPGVSIWTSPIGHTYRRDHTGTTALDPPSPTDPLRSTGTSRPVDPSHSTDPRPQVPHPRSERRHPRPDPPDRP